MNFIPITISPFSFFSSLQFSFFIYLSTRKIPPLGGVLSLILVWCVTLYIINIFAFFSENDVCLVCGHGLDLMR